MKHNIQTIILPLLLSSTLNAQDEHFPDTLQTHHHITQTHMKQGEIAEVLHDTLLRYRIPIKHFSPPELNTYVIDYLNQIRQQHGKTTLATDTALLEVTLSLAKHAPDTKHIPMFTIQQALFYGGIRHTGNIAEIILHWTGDMTIEELIHTRGSSPAHAKVLGGMYSIGAIVPIDLPGGTTIARMIFVEQEKKD